MYSLVIFGFLVFQCVEKESVNQNLESPAQQDKAIGILRLREVDEEATSQKEAVQKAIDDLKASGTMSNKEMLNGTKVSEYLSTNHPELLRAGSAFRWQYKRGQGADEASTAERESFILKAQVLEIEIKEAILAWGANGASYISIELTQKSGKDFAQITKDNVGKRFAIIHDEMVLTAPVIRSVINGGRIAIDAGSKVSDKSGKENKWLLEKLISNK